MNRRRFLKTAASGSLMLRVAGCSAPKSVAGRPNLFIYIADDQYKSSLGCYSAVPSHTPNIDRLASQGMRFTNCFTQSSICTPNRGTLFTGMYPLKHGAHANHSGFYDGVKSLPNYMKEAGYRACIVGKDHIAKPSDLYRWEFRIEKSAERMPGADEPQHDRHRKTDFYQVEKFITANDQRPFCLVHGASLPHAPNLTELPNGLKGYDASNWYLDYELGRYLELFDRLGLLDSMVILYVNDNESQQPRSKFTLFETGLHVPMIVRWPGKVKAGVVCDAMVGFIDILPTLLEIVHKDLPADVDGKSLLDLWQGRSDHHHQELFASYTGVLVSTLRQEIPYPIRSLRDRRYKYIRTLNHQVGHPKQNDAFFPYEQLFDLSADPGETVNLASEPRLQAIKHRMSAKVDAWMARMGDQGVESERQTLKKYPAKQTL